MKMQVIETNRMHSFFRDSNFSYHNYYFWIPVVAPFFGTVFAAWSYYLFVGFHIVDRHPSAVYLKDIKDDNGDSVPLKKNSYVLSNRFFFALYRLLLLMNAIWQEHSFLVRRLLYDQL